MRNLKECTVEDLKKIGKYDHINLIWKAIMEMDAIFLEDLLVENIIYKNSTKKNIGRQKFIEDLDFLFEKHQAWDDDRFLLDFEVYKSYNNKEPVCKFIGNDSKNAFYLHFETIGKKIIRIHQCFHLLDYEECPF